MEGSAADEQEDASFVRQAVLYVLCGLVAAAVYLTTITALVELAGLPTWLATTGGFSLATVVSYLLNARFTFQRQMDRRAFVRFWLVQIVNLVVSVAIVEGAGLVGLHYLIGAFGSLVVAPALSFLAHRYWTFRRPAPPALPD